MSKNGIFMEREMLHQEKLFLVPGQRRNRYAQHS